MPWMGLNTCFYAEITNKGVSIDQAQKVKWRGIKQLTMDHA
jgi:pectinesterase